MKILITAGPTREPIDPVRYIGNRSSGKTGAALAAAGVKAGHEVTLILGPGVVEMPGKARRIDVETAREMFEAVMGEFPGHDLLIMAAAVADFRPRGKVAGKIERGGKLTIELESTEDIVAAAGGIKRTDQRTVGFSLVGRGELERSREKLKRKKLDLIVRNPIETISAETIESVLIYADGREEELGCRGKGELADILIERACGLFA